MKNTKIAIIGLGYVGLPLAVEFGKQYPTLGYDINQDRINELENGFDRTLELDSTELKKSKKLIFTYNINDLSKANTYIITVPTPIDKNNNPDITLLLQASKMVGTLLNKGDIVIYESTVYPGCTEEDCVPVLEKESNLKYNKDFFCGYSPERINPGDKNHTLVKIVKVTSGSNAQTAKHVDLLYKSIIKAGTYLASSIKIAESAKIIENCQRDINIAFVNELAMLFNKMDIDTKEVLEAANTKWNFLDFKPGLVGGHCIGVDPYYLTYKSEKIGYKSKIILAGRKLNDDVPNYISKKVYDMMQNLNTGKMNLLILGITFKENCPDVRNSGAVNIYKYFNKKDIAIDVFDPYADKEEVKNIYDINLAKFDDICKIKYSGIIICVNHSEFKNFPLSKVSNSNTVIYDVKSMFEKKYERL